MKTYKITASTNGYIASRDIMFNGKTIITIDKNLTLKEALKELDKYFFMDYEYSHDQCVESYNEETDEFIFCKDNRWTDYEDGTASYEYDSRYYRIEEEIAENI